MKRKFWLILLALGGSLFIYLFYRTEKTVVNEIATWLITKESYQNLRSFFSANLRLNEFIVYSLPEGLWVFCITLTSAFLFIRIRNHEVHLLYAPLVFSIGLEFLQLFHITNGRFDIMDIFSSLLFWSIGVYLAKSRTEKQYILSPVTQRSISCIISYSIVYLAHVWQ